MLVTRQGAGNLLFGSDVFIEDRVAAGVVSGEDVLLATAVDLVMARECEGRPQLLLLSDDVSALLLLFCVALDVVATSCAHSHSRPCFAAFVGTFSCHFSRLKCVYRPSQNQRRKLTQLTHLLISVCDLANIARARRLVLGTQQLLHAVVHVQDVTKIQ